MSRPDHFNPEEGIPRLKIRKTKEGQHVAEQLTARDVNHNQIPLWTPKGTASDRHVGGSQTQGKKRSHAKKHQRHHRPKRPRQEATVDERTPEEYVESLFCSPSRDSPPPCPANLLSDMSRSSFDLSSTESSFCSPAQHGDTVLKDSFSDVGPSSALGNETLVVGEQGNSSSLGSETLVVREQGNRYEEEGETAVDAPTTHANLGLLSEEDSGSDVVNDSVSSEGAEVAVRGNTEIQAQNTSDIPIPRNIFFMLDLTDESQSDVSQPASTESTNGTEPVPRIKEEQEDSENVPPVPVLDMKEEPPEDESRDMIPIVVNSMPSERLNNISCLGYYFSLDQLEAWSTGSKATDSSGTMLKPTLLHRMLGPPPVERSSTKFTVGIDIKVEDDSTNITGGTDDSDSTNITGGTDDSDSTNINNNAVESDSSNITGGGDESNFTNITGDTDIKVEVKPEGPCCYCLKDDDIQMLYYGPSTGARKRRQRISREDANGDAFDLKTVKTEEGCSVQSSKNLAIATVSSVSSKEEATASKENDGLRADASESLTSLERSVPTSFPERSPQNRAPISEENLEKYNKDLDEDCPTQALAPESHGPKPTASVEKETEKIPVASPAVSGGNNSVQNERIDRTESIALLMNKDSSNQQSCPSGDEATATKDISVPDAQSGPYQNNVHSGIVTYSTTPDWQYSTVDMCNTNSKVDQVLPTSNPPMLTSSSQATPSQLCGSHICRQDVVTPYPSYGSNLYHRSFSCDHEYHHHHPPPQPPQHPHHHHLQQNGAAAGFPVIPIPLPVMVSTHLQDKVMLSTCAQAQAPSSSSKSLSITKTFECTVIELTEQEPHGGDGGKSPYPYLVLLPNRSVSYFNSQGFCQEEVVLIRKELTRNGRLTVELFVKHQHLLNKLSGLACFRHLEALREYFPPVEPVSCISAQEQFLLFMIKLCTNCSDRDLGSWSGQTYSDARDMFYAVLMRLAEALRRDPSYPWPSCARLQAITAWQNHLRSQQFCTPSLMVLAEGAPLKLEYIGQVQMFRVLRQNLGEYAVDIVGVCDTLYTINQRRQFTEFYPDRYDDMLCRNCTKGPYARLEKSPEEGGETHENIG